MEVKAAREGIGDLPSLKPKPIMFEGANASMPYGTVVELWNLPSPFSCGASVLFIAVSVYYLTCY